MRVSARNPALTPYSYTNDAIRVVAHAPDAGFDVPAAALDVVAGGDRPREAECQELALAERNLILRIRLSTEYHRSPPA